VLANALVA